MEEREKTRIEITRKKTPHAQLHQNIMKITKVVKMSF